MSDSEIITISIVGELLTIDSENAWFKFCKNNVKDLFPKFCDRTKFNRTRRILHAVIEAIRKELSLITELAEQLCKFGRAKFHKTFKGYGATYGKCPSKKETYLGYKLHMFTTLDGLVTDFVITSANIDDRAAVWELIDSHNNITVLGDKGYTKADLSTDLKSLKGIELLPVQKSNSKIQFPNAIRQLIFKLRRRIETTASQLAEQLNIERVCFASRKCIM